MSEDWFRNKTWDDTVERRFKEKLRRARRKAQYLRIQACTLARSHPEVALRLLDQYFAMREDFDEAQAHVDRATALLAQGRIDEAIGAYEAALKREAEYPHLLTGAYLDLPYLIATRGIQEKYAEAMELLKNHKSRLMFPVDYFRCHAALALIAAARQDSPAAKDHALQALEAAALDHSRFRNHPTLGLVTEVYDDLILKLKQYADE
jgi:tetratricopeptide (TPR) repeat protein